MVRTEQESDSKIREEEWQTCWCFFLNGSVQCHQNSSTHWVHQYSFKNLCFLLLLLVTQTLLRDGGMVGDHGAPEAGQLPRSGPEVIERQRVAKE